MEYMCNLDVRLHFRMRSVEVPAQPARTSLIRDVTLLISRARKNTSQQGDPPPLSHYYHHSHNSQSDQNDLKKVL